MTFVRFGNTFIAYDNDNRLYVVSLYLGSWHAYWRRDDDGSPQEIGMYGYGSVEEAKRAASDHAATTLSVES